MEANDTANFVHSTADENLQSNESLINNFKTNFPPENQQHTDNNKG